MAITVEYREPKKLAGQQSIFVSFPYKQKIVDTIRLISERYWDGKNKVWELSYDALSFLQKRLPREQFIIKGEPITDKKFGEKLIDKHYELPKELKTKLYKYQEEDFNELMNFDRYLLLLAPGLGKSILAIATALKRKELGQIKHCLVICGVNTLKYNWQEEIKTHTGLSSQVLGSRRKKNGIWQTAGTKEKLEDLEHLDEFFIITNIESLRVKEIKEKIKKYIDKGEIGMMVVDEMHKTKNVSSQQGKALLLLAKHIKYFYGLTGTLIANNPLDTYLPLKCVGKEPANYSQFQSRYCVFGGFGGREIISYKHLDELQKKLDDISKRRLKSDVLDLPPKIYIDEYLEMGTKQAKLYSDVLKVIMEDIDRVNLSPDPLAQLLRLRQITADTSILSDTISESVKMDRLQDIIAERVANGSKVIVFSNWTSVTDIAYRLLVGYNPAQITGQITDRETQKKRFMEDGDCKVIVCTTGAAGVGLTLTAADTVIFLDEPWTSAAKTQAEDRAYRIGTKDTVRIITLMCKGTIDEYIHHIIRKKQVISDTLIDKKYDIKNKDVVTYLLTGRGEIDG